MQEGFTHKERIVAGRFGLSRNQIRLARQGHLKKGVHWIIGAGRCVMLNDEGLKILSELGDLPPVSSKEPVDLSEKKVAPRDDGALQRGDYVSLKVYRTYPTHNRQYIEAYPAGLEPTRENIWRVKIHPAACEMFTKNMEFEALFVRERFCECRRKPRKKGRW